MYDANTYGILCDFFMREVLCEDLPAVEDDFVNHTSREARALALALLDRLSYEDLSITDTEELDD